MSDIQDLIEQLVRDTVKDCIDEAIENAIEDSYRIQEMRDDIDSVKNDVENFDEYEVSRSVVNQIASSLLEDTQAVYKVTYVTGLVNRVNELQEKLDEATAKIGNDEYVKVKPTESTTEQLRLGDRNVPFFF